MNKSRFDIYNRAFEFAVKTAKFTKKMPKNSVTMEYAKQLIRSSSSVGANLEEADGALTKKDFINKLGIARRESSESRHWLKLIHSVENFTSKELNGELSWLIKEAEELKLILSSIISKTKKNAKGA